MIIGLIIIVAAISLDQVTKHLAANFLSNGKIITAIPHVLEFQYSENSGAAWGMFQGQQIFFFVMTAIALAVLIFLFTKANFKNKKVYTIAIALLISGALGNAIDRIFLRNSSNVGYVIDFLHMPFLDFLENINISNFIFNFADVFITFGVILFIVEIFFLDGKRKKNEKIDNS